MSTADYLKRLVDAAPPLTADQRARLAILLAPGPSRRVESARPSVGTA